MEYSLSEADETRSRDVLRKIRALLVRANHAGTPQAEAESALAIAYRLMVKYDLDDREVGHSRYDRQPYSEKVVSRKYYTTGPYRVRRCALRYAIANVLSCAYCRDSNLDDAETVVSIAFGTEADLDALEILYTAAELLALRMMPTGNRSFRTSWFHGFTRGVEEKLMSERNKMTRARQGMEIVLRSRMDRASTMMRLSIPGLVRGRSANVAWAEAFTDGQRAGSTFTAGGRGVAGIRGALPSGN